MLSTFWLRSSTFFWWCFGLSAFWLAFFHPVLQLCCFKDTSPFSWHTYHCLSFIMLTSLLQGTAVHILTIFYRNVTVGVDVFDILNLITLSPVVLRPWGHLLSHEYSIVVSFFFTNTWSKFDICIYFSGPTFTKIHSCITSETFDNFCERCCLWRSWMVFCKMFGPEPELLLISISSCCAFTFK